MKKSPDMCHLSPIACHMSVGPCHLSPVSNANSRRPSPFHFPQYAQYDGAPAETQKTLFFYAKRLKPLWGKGDRFGNFANTLLSLSSLE